MADIHYISIDEARDIHLATIRNSGGGDCGELDIGKLESVLCHIQNDNYYPTFLDKLLHLFYCSRQILDLILHKSSIGPNRYTPIFIFHEYH